MKTLKISILGWLATVVVCSSQNTQPGWFQTGTNVHSVLSPYPSQAIATSAARTMNLMTPMLSGGQPSGPVAEVITPHIQALADGLQDDPVQIFNYVHDHIDFVLYFGSKKGAELTLLEKSGNDFDQCALLVALLRAAGYTNAPGSSGGVGYQFGWEEIPYTDPYGLGYDLQHWWQLTLANTNWTNTYTYFGDLVTARGYPQAYYFGDGNTVDLQRVWVTLTIGSTTYQLDPAFKISQQTAPLSGFSLTNAMVGTGASISNALMTAAAGTDAGNYVQSLSESAVRAKLTSYTTNLLNYIQTNAPNTSMWDILGYWATVPAYDPWDYSTTTWFTTNNPNGQMPVLSWTYEPTNMMSTLQATFAGTNYYWFMPQLQGQRLALTYDTNGVAQLWQEDTLLAQGQASLVGGTNGVVVSVTHPFGTWDTVNNVLIYDPTNFANTTVTNTYQSTNSTYALLYAFEPDWGWLQQRENKLDLYLQQGLTSSSRQVTSETLNIMGLSWMLQTKRVGQILGSQLGILPHQFFHRIGRMAQEAGKGYYVDIYMQFSGAFPSGGVGTPQVQQAFTYTDLWADFGSAMEHGIIEQMQNTNLVGASAVKMLEIANTNAQVIYLASSTNWATAYNVQSHLANYSSTTLASISNQISSGYYVLLPQNGSNHVSSATGSWAGYGYEAFQQVFLTGANAAWMVVSGGYHGGFSSSSTVPINPPYVDTTGDNQPTYFASTPVSTPAPQGADPVDIADGTFQVENTDLSLGQAEPRGISLTRYYNGTRRFTNPAGMAGGWIHNYSITANTIAAPQACLGYTTPAQVAPMLVAVTAAMATYNGGVPEPKNWMVTTLISKWSIDQLTKSGVSISLGKDTLQFVEQPNGVFTPPANSTATLTQNGSAYSLQMRHGNRFNFSVAGLLTNIVDTYGQSMNLTYNASNWVSTVKDSKGRQLTFNYSGTPQQLTSVTDNSSPSRSVSYGYTTVFNAQGDLVSFTDAEGKTSAYCYDTNHNIVATTNALNQLVVSNVYDSQWHVATQYTQGVTNKTWRIFWSDWQTVSEDPAGGVQQYFYDNQHRLIEQADALGNVSQTFYDGQNHTIETISPLNETNLFLYDGSNDLVQSIDTLGYTNRLFYNSQNSMVTNINPRGNVSTFGYNTNFSLTGQTNGTGDFVNYTYNTNGTLATRADSGGTTTYSYDSFGQLTNITYPGSLGSESFANSSLGDVTNHTDARGFSTAFQYNNRRQLTNTVAPTNLVTQIAYDPVGNTASTTDPRGNTISNTWSATRHLLATTMPAVPQGIPVTTNLYDNRDWLTSVRDPLQNLTQYTNDADEHLISATDPLSRTTLFDYDADGRKIATTNAAGETTFQSWDARNELIQLIDGAGHTVLRVYDATGNQIVLTNRNGNKWQFQFDAANRLTNTISPLGRSTSMTYNHQGLVTLIKDPLGRQTTNNYDAKGRLTNRIDNFATTLYHYDGNNNLTNVAETGNTNAWTYDAYSRVSSCKDIYGNLIQYHYDGNGNLTNLVYPGGKNVYYAYDNLNRMTNVTDWAGRKTTIGYDLDSHVTSITRPNGTYRTISYDSAGQATNILEQMANGLPIAALQYNWDNAARVQWEFLAPLPHTVTIPTRTMTYNADNQLATFQGPTMGSPSTVTLDLDGNLTNGPATNDTFINYTYDARNRLLNAGDVTNAYDAMNNRVGQITATSTNIFMLNPNAKLPQMLMRVKNSVTNYYVYGPGLLYQVTEAPTATNTLTYHYDYRGSTIALSGDNGLVTDRIEYSAYGLTTYRAGTNDTPFLFNGRYGVQTDPNGLLYMQARYYNPYLCRFINADPSGFKGGLNFYAYANGNPVSYLDPFGLGAVGESSSSSWLANGWNAVTSTASTAGQDVLNVAYTGQLNPSPDVYNAAVDAAGDYIYDSGGVRGFYGGVGINGKSPGTGSLAGQVGLTGTWTVDDGAGTEIDAGLGLQQRGRNSLGLFTSQTVGVGSSYQFWSQNTGFQAPSFGSSGNISMPSIYGGTANSQGGANFVIQNQNNAAIGINYGPVYGGLIINPSLVIQNFIDSYHVLNGTFNP